MPTLSDLRSLYRPRRKAFLDRHADVASGRGLEIGAFDYPTVLPDEGRCEYADVADRDELAERHGIAPETIVSIDYRLDRDLPISEQIETRFDWVAFCHVLEHVPDVVRSLNDAARLLAPGGVLFLALPDKRRTLDAGRPSTSLDRLLERFAGHETRPSYAEVASFARHWIDDFDTWATDQPRAFHDWVAQQIAGDQADVHCNVWRDSEFFEQLQTLIRMGLVEGLDLIDTEWNWPPFNEFYVALRKNEGAEPQNETTGIHHRACNFCGETFFRPYLRRAIPFPERIYGDATLSQPDIGERLQLQYLECSACGLIGINPLPRFADVDKHRFDGERNIIAWTTPEYAQYESEKREISRIVYEQYELEGYRKENTALDVGCGPGVTLSWLRDEQGWRVHGIDPDRYAQRQAKLRYGLEIENGLIHDVSLEEESLDLIVMDNSLEHTFDPTAALLRAYRLLRKGGACFIFVPNSEGLSSKAFGENAYWGHWFFYSPAALVAHLERIGFEIPRLIAIQNPVNPALADAGIDVEAHRAALEVHLDSHDVVTRTVRDQPLVADYFNLLAVKPVDAPIASPAEDDLLTRAARSRAERDAVQLESEDFPIR